MSKERLDTLLVERGFAPTQQKAQAIILTGRVLVDDQPFDKAGVLVDVDAEIRIKGEISRFVGRGGEKIAPAFDLFGINLQGVVALDVGASTGGFTDCMLQRGAAKVYALDVGYNQLAHSLRVDPRVVVMEQTHADSLRAGQFNPAPSVATMDVSFISVRKILQPVVSALSDAAELVILVKPQFELSREFVGEGGLVKEPELQQRAVALVAELAEQIGMTVRASCPCALRGQRKGNQEYFLHVVRGG